MSLAGLLGVDEPDEVVEEVIEKVQTLTPFDFVNSISFSKIDLFEGNDNAEKQYNPYIVNRALSFGADTVIYANEMNKMSHIPRREQFNFLMMAIRKRKRYDSWIKAEKESEEISIIKAYYNYSDEKAKIALNILLPNQIDELKARLFKGGMATRPLKAKKKTKEPDFD